MDYSDGEEDTPPPRRSRSSSSAGLGGDDQAHIQSAQKAMARLYELNEASDWKKVLKCARTLARSIAHRCRHKKGVVVYQRREGKGPPVYKGENIIKGCAWRRGLSSTHAAQTARAPSSPSSARASCGTTGTRVRRCPAGLAHSARRLACRQSR